MSACTWEPFSAFIAQVEEMCLRLYWAFLLLAVEEGVLYSPCFFKGKGFQRSNSLLSVLSQVVENCLFL